MQSSAQNKPGQAADVADLLARALEGEDDARLDLAVFIGKQVYRVAINEAPKCGLRWQQEDYDDFCQDMLKALFEKDSRRLRTIKNPNTFNGWLKVTVTMALIDRRRRRDEAQRDRTDTIHGQRGAEGEDFTLEDVLSGDSAQPGEILMYKELLEQIRRASRAVLSAEEQRILELWGSRQYSLEEIGLLIGMNPSTVGVRINRAKVKVLEHVKKQEEGAV